MKNKKKIIICTVVAAAILAVGILAGVLIGKSGADKKEEDESSTISTTTTNTTTTEDSTTTTDMPTSKKNEQNNSVTVVEGIISNTDRNNFARILGNILYNGFNSEDPPHSDDGYTDKEFALHNYRPYDYKTADAKQYAYSRLITGVDTLLEAMVEVYNWDDFEIKEVWKESEEDDSFESDPKGLLGDYYCIVEAKYIDMAIKNVFNIDPDHSYVLKSKDGLVHAYYYNGNYYFRGDEGGAMNSEAVISNVKVMDDGKYEINATWNIADSGKILDLKIIAEMKTVEGKSFWSFYKIEKA